MLDESAVRAKWQALVESYGGVRATAAALKLAPSYVGDVKNGRRGVGGAVLRILGLKKVIGYVPAK